MQSCVDMEAQFQTNISPSPVVTPLKQYHLRAEHVFLQTFSLRCAFNALFIYNFIFLPNEAHIFSRLM